MTQRHLSDADLLLLGEGELPLWRRGQAGRHFVRCAVCRGRSEALAVTLHDVVRESRRGVEADVSGVRSALIAGMAGSRRVGLFGSRGVQQLASACMAVLIVAAIGWTWRMSDFSVLRRWDLRGENAALPIRRLTPGAVREAHLEDLCRTQDPDNDRAIDGTTEQRVFQEYGLPMSKRAEFAVDYLITPGLGGSDDIRNLWPEPDGTSAWNAQVKDQLESHLHEMVCAGRMPLAQAQAEIATDWISAYKRYFPTQRSGAPREGWTEARVR